MTLEKLAGEDDHALYAPSATYRNLSCKGSLALIQSLKNSGRIPTKSESSIFAKEGTLAHDWAKKALTCIHKQIHFDFMTIPDDEMRVHVTNYCAFIGELNTKFRHTCEGVQFYIEQKVKCDDDFWGTADYVLTGFHKRTKEPMAVIADLKYGKGVEVDVEENEQLLSYAVCLSHTLKRAFSVVHCFIYQPRTPGKEFNRWTIDSKILDGAESVILSNKEECLAILESGDYEPHLNAGEWCRFCPAKMNCKAYQEDLNSTKLQILADLPEVLPEEPKIHELSIEQKVEIFKRRKSLKKFIDDICADLLVTANNGTEVPGYKIVTGTRRRGWKKEMPDSDGTICSKEDAINVIGSYLQDLGVEEPFKKSLKGIGEIEKEIGKGKIDDLTELSRPSYQLVPISDKREAIQSIALEDLEEVEFTE